MRVKQILFYTRPWEDDFHLELARQLQERYSGVPVRFVTFFISSFRKATAAGYKAVYFPDELNKVSGDEISAERFAGIDRQLYETGGANFNLMLHAERFLPDSAEQAEQFGKKHLVVLNRLVTEGTLSISSMYDHFVYWLAGGLANARNGGHFAFVGCGLPAGRTLALKTPWNTWERPGVAPEDAKLFLESSIAAMDIPAVERISYMKPVKRKKKTWAERWAFYREIRYDKQAGSYFWTTMISPGQWACEKILPGKLYRKLFFHPDADYTLNLTEELQDVRDKYVYLPLHMEPEAVILMYSPWLRDQTEVVRLTAQALPVGWKLLVKENPKMRGHRPPGFYRKIQAMPNVRLVAPEVSSTALIRGSEAVVALAGTATLEARLLGKPGFCLGAPPFIELLCGGDIASGKFCLRTLFENISEAAPESMNLHEWTRRIAGTVEGNSLPVNSDSFTSFVVDCVGKNHAAKE